jgi:hypothetical protein
VLVDEEDTVLHRVDELFVLFEFPLALAALGDVPDDAGEVPLPVVLDVAERDGERNLGAVGVLAGEFDILPVDRPLVRSQVPSERLAVSAGQVVGHQFRQRLADQGLLVMPEHLFDRRVHRPDRAAFVYCDDDVAGRLRERPVLLELARRFVVGSVGVLVRVVGSLRRLALRAVTTDADRSSLLVCGERVDPQFDGHRLAVVGPYRDVDGHLRPRLRVAALALNPVESVI